MSEALERLQKVIAQSGLTSRRKAETLIVEGKVKVNKEVVTKLGTKVTKNDLVEVNNIPLQKEEPVYYMLYKPREVISSLNDEKGRRIVTDYLPEIPERIFPVGRLDYHTSGLLLLTNDGDFANLLMHPRYEIEKVYVAKTEGIPSKDELSRLITGVESDGDLLKVEKYNVLSIDKQKKTMIIELTLKEGKNRHIRRMMEALNFPIMKLSREKYGLLTLDGLNSGEARALTPHEVKRMRVLATHKIEG